MRILVQAECSSVGECGIITENTAQGETTLAKKKPLKKDRKAGRGNLPAQKRRMGWVKGFEPSAFRATI